MARSRVVFRMDEAGAPMDARGVVAEALRTGRLPAIASRHDVETLLDVARDEGVLPLLDWMLRQGAGSRADGVPLAAPFRDALAEGAQAAARQELHREGELRRIARAVESAGIRMLLLKGSALGRWLYPAPYLRVSADIDVLVESRAMAERVLAIVAPLGYALAYAPSPGSHEMTARLQVDGVSRSELDLHCRLLNAAAYADILGFQDLWHESQPVASIGAGMRVLSPRHALAHACLNRALDMQNGEPDRLKLLYDIHLLSQRMDASAWSGFVDMCTPRGICGACLRSLQDTVSIFHAEVPADALATLRARAGEESLDWRRLHDWRYMQWRHLRALPSLRARVAWVWQRLLPSSGHLRELHGEGSWPTLVMRRLRRLWQRFAS